MVALPWSKPRANGRLVRFCENEAVEFEVFADGEELRGVEVGGDRSERWPRSVATAYITPDGPLYLVNATIPQVADAASLFDLEERIAFNALNEATQSDRWTYTTMMLGACLIALVFIIILCWMAAGAAKEAQGAVNGMSATVNDLRQLLPTPTPRVRP